jgi:DNA mismatch repair protein MSH3
MRFQQEGEEGSENVTFLYEVGEGVAHRSYGLNVARLANIPESVIHMARERSRELEEKTKAKRLAALVGMLGKKEIVEEDKLQALVEGIELL